MNENIVDSLNVERFLNFRVRSSEKMNEDEGWEEQIERGHTSTPMTST